VLYTTSCKHSLVLLRIGETIARNMLSWLKLLIKLLFMHLVGCLYYCFNDARSHKRQIWRLKICSLSAFMRAFPSVLVFRYNLVTAMIFNYDLIFGEFPWGRQWVEFLFVRDGGYMQGLAFVIQKTLLRSSTFLLYWEPASQNTMPVARLCIGYNKHCEGVRHEKRKW